MITEFQIGKLYIVNNPYNVNGITNGTLNFIPNGTILALIDIQPERFINKEIVKNRFIYYFWILDKIWYCNAYYFDFVKYFDEVRETE